MNSPSLSSAPVAVIGAGPVGLAAAAHLVQRGLPVVVFEAGAAVADHLGSYRQVRLFSPWRYNIDRAARALLVAVGWRAPDDDRLPTAQEQRARAVIDASGTWSQPNPLGIHGLPAKGEVQAREHIVHGMPDILGQDRDRYTGRKVLVVGAGHSAAGNLLALATLAEQVPGTRLAWAVRGTDLRRLFGGGDKDGLPARGELGRRLRALVDTAQLELHLGFGINEITDTPQGLRILPADPTKAPIEGVDEIIAATGSRPDLGIARELRLRLDPWLESTDALAPLIDPNVHSCGTVRPHGHRELAHPEPGFYAIGAKSYGRAPNFLMTTGYEQARSVVAALAGDLEAADDVQLELPETGVCSVDRASPGLVGDDDVDGSGNGGACCGGPAKADATACCVLDEVKKAEGEAGCGCGSKAAATPPVVAQAPAPARPAAACCG
jgi:thioredoxin reductase